MSLKVERNTCVFCVCVIITALENDSIPKPYALSTQWGKVTDPRTLSLTPPRCRYATVSKAPLDSVAKAAPLTHRTK